MQSSSTKRKVVGRTQYGRKKVLSEKHTLQFDIHDFESLPSKRGTVTGVGTKSLSCHGTKWYLTVFPGGSIHSTCMDYVSIYLNNRKCEKTEDHTVVANFSIRVGSMERTFQSTFKSQHFRWGWHDFVKRSDVLDPSRGYLVDGTLSIEVDIQVYTEKKAVWTPPRKSSTDTMLQLLGSQEFADITFVVDGRKFPANRCILAVNAPYLYSLTEETGKEDQIEISGMDPAVFKALLRFIYTSEIPDVSLLRAKGRGLLAAANRFECKSFKLEVESSIVTSVIDENNAAEWLLLADSHSCALLKEAAINIISRQMNTITTTSGWALLRSSATLLAEIMESQQNCKSDDDEIGNLDVGSLRDRLTEKGLDVDGTRDMLVNRLKKKPADAARRRSRKRKILS